MPQDISVFDYLSPVFQHPTIAMPLWVYPFCFAGAVLLLTQFMKLLNKRVPPKTMPVKKSFWRSDLFLALWLSFIVIAPWPIFTIALHWKMASGAAAALTVANEKMINPHEGVSPYMDTENGAFALSAYPKTFQTHSAHQQNASFVQSVWKLFHPSQDFPNYTKLTGDINIIRVDKTLDNVTFPVAYCLYSDQQHIDTYLLLGWMPPHPNTQNLRDKCPNDFPAEGIDVLPSNSLFAGYTKSEE